MPAKLTRADVLKVATLARLRLSDAEIDDYTEKLGRILEYVESLGEVNTDEVEPLVHAEEIGNVFRDDVVLPSLPRQAALANAPRSDGRFFLVPQILEGA